MQLFLLIFFCLGCSNAFGIPLPRPSFQVAFWPPDAIPHPHPPTQPKEKENWAYK